MINYSPSETRLHNLLNRVAALAAVLFVVGCVLAYGQATSAFIGTPFGPIAVAGLGILGLLAWFGAADVRRHRQLIYLLIFGLGAGAVAGTTLALGLSAAGRLVPLLLLAALFALGDVLIIIRLRAAQPRAAIWSPWLTDKPFLSNWEKISRVFALILGVGLLVVALGLLFATTTGLAGPWALQPALTLGSILFLASMGACVLFVAWDVRRYTEMFTLFILGGVGVLIATLCALRGQIQAGATSDVRTLLIGLALLQAVIIALCIALKTLMNRHLLDHLGFFNALDFRVLEAVAESLIDGEGAEKSPPYKIALRTDNYLSSFKSGRLWLAKAALLMLEFAPLTAFMPPINFLNPALRKGFIDANFKRDIVEARGIYWLFRQFEKSSNTFISLVGRRSVDLIEGAMRFNMQLTYIGYYSDPDVQSAIGYIPFSQRNNTFPVKPIRRYPALKVITSKDLINSATDVIRNADVVIIGSGAGGGILAEQLANQGREVLVLEKGPYVSPDDFSEDETAMISKLYSDGALQIAQSLHFTVLQGSCVGGTTVVNNAVCFETPQPVLDKWNDSSGWNAGIDEAMFRQAQHDVMKRMQIRRIDESLVTRSNDLSSVLNPGDVVLQRGIQRLMENQANTASDKYEFGIVKANITDCLGCGYCNLGCAYGRKLSMLDEVLPCAQKAHGSDKFRIIAEAKVTRLISKDRAGASGGKITEIVVEVGGGRELIIQNPKTVIVSAGTIASSWLLMQSGIGKDLPVGRGLSFNMGSPLYGVFPEKLDSYAGLQIAHYLKVKDHPGFVLESWYNPPVAQALSMPGWLDTHFKNMSRYDHIAAAGVLVGTERNGYLTPAVFLRGAPDVVYSPTPKDLSKLADAFVEFGRVLFSAGATEVFASTRRYHSFQVANSAGRGVLRGEDALAQFHSFIKDERDILLGTGHPQGGNAISKSRGKLLAKNDFTGGVIDPDFKVWGYDNLYVCDASVFPGSLTVNPQLTVMTMAHYAAARIR